MSTVTVDAAALRTVLAALNGPSHHIRELQATRSLKALGHYSPIDTLIEQFNAQVKPAAQNPANASREYYFALRDSHASGAEESYFGARPQHDNDERRTGFNDGFDRGFDAAEAIFNPPPALPTGHAVRAKGGTA